MSGWWWSLAEGHKRRMAGGCGGMWSVIHVNLCLMIFQVRILFRNFIVIFR